MRPSRASTRGAMRAMPHGPAPSPRERARRRVAADDKHPHPGVVWASMVSGHRSAPVPHRDSADGAARRLERGWPRSGRTTSWPSSCTSSSCAVPLSSRMIRELRMMSSCRNSARTSFCPILAPARNVGVVALGPRPRRPARRSSGVLVGRGSLGRSPSSRRPYERHRSPCGRLGLGSACPDVELALIYDTRKPAGGAR